MLGSLPRFGTFYAQEPSQTATRQVDLAKFIQILIEQRSPGNRVGKAAGRLGCGSGGKASELPRISTAPTPITERLLPSECRVAFGKAERCGVSARAKLTARCVALPEPRSTAYRASRESLERQCTPGHWVGWCTVHLARRAAWDPGDKCSPGCNGNCRQSRHIRCCLLQPSLTCITWFI